MLGASGTSGTPGSFDFLGYTFHSRLCKNTKRYSVFMNFTPAVSKDALKSMRTTTRKDDLRNRTDLSLDDIARWYNPKLQGWLNYYGKYSRSALYPADVPATARPSWDCK